MDKKNLIGWAGIFSLLTGVSFASEYVPSINTDVSNIEIVAQKISNFEPLPLPPLEGVNNPYKLNNGSSQYTQNELRSVAVANKINDKELSVFATDNGSIQYVYGQAMAVVVCTPMRLCNVSLEPGEVVNDVHIGDGVRWEVSPSVSGNAPNQVVHAIVKPSEVGIETSLMITTDRRVYHMNLKSSASDYMPSVSFHYPGNQDNQWDDLMNLQQEAMMEASLRTAEANKQEPVPAEVARLGISVDQLNFNYLVKGDSKYSWHPLRVFDDGIRTYIELPSNAINGDLPIILGEDSTEEIVNYRLKDNRYIVDGISKRLVMMKDVGRKQQRLTIVRK